MKNYMLNVIPKQYMVLFLLVTCVTYSFGQDNYTFPDTTHKTEFISHPEIPVQAAKVIIRTNRMSESLITDKKILFLTNENDSIINVLDSLLTLDRAYSFKLQDIRKLNNKLVFWNRSSNHLEKEKQKVLSEIEILKEHQNYLDRRIKTWEHTLKSLNSGNPDAISRSKNVLDLLVKTRNKVIEKSMKLNRMLDNNTELSIDIADHRDKITNSIEELKSNMFVRQQESFFSFNYNNKTTWALQEPVKLFYSLEVKPLQNYIISNTAKITLLLIILVFLIVGFKRLSLSNLSNKIKKPTFYTDHLLKISPRNISVGLLLALFISGIMFPNRPELFRDLTRLISIIPIIFIVKQVIKPRFHFFIYLLTLLLYFQIGVFVFPAGNMFNRLSLLSIAFIELFAFWKLYFVVKEIYSSNKKRRKLISWFISAHIGIILVGMAGTISGAVRLAKLCLNFPIINAYAAIIILLVIIIINGLIQISLQSNYLKKLNFVRLYGEFLSVKTVRVINIIGIGFWLYTMLTILNINKTLFNKINTILEYQMNIGNISFSLEGITVFFLVIWLSIVLSKGIHIILEKDVLNKFSLAKGVPHTIAMMVRYTVITLGVILAIGAAGLPLQNFTILFGAFGVGIGFGLQNIFNNLVSGFILLFERPIQIGDTIEVGELIGNVKSIGIRSSNIRTFDGAEVIVPNGQLISNEVVNWTLSDQQRRIEVLAGVAYGSDVHKVKSLLTKILEEHPDIINAPAPAVLFSSMGESSLDFRLLFWTANVGEWLRIKSEVTFLVHDKLNEEGIEIPFPQRDLHLRSVDPDIEIVKKKG